MPEVKRSTVPRDSLTVTVEDHFSFPMPTKVVSDGNGVVNGTS